MMGICHLTKRLTTISLVVACFALAIYWPEWRNELQAQGYRNECRDQTMEHPFGGVLLVGESRCYTPAERTDQWWWVDADFEADRDLYQQIDEGCHILCHPRVLDCPQPPVGFGQYCRNLHRENRALGEIEFSGVDCEDGGRKRIATASGFFCRCKCKDLFED